LRAYFVEHGFLESRSRRAMSVVRKVDAIE
jgi:hypothetical protein